MYMVLNPHWYSSVFSWNCRWVFDTTCSRTAVVSKELNVSRLFECGVPALYGLQKTWKCRACGLWIRGRWSSAIAMQRPSCVEIEFLKGAPVKERGPESLYRFFRFTMWNLTFEDNVLLITSVAIKLDVQMWLKEFLSMIFSCLIRELWLVLRSQHLTLSILHASWANPSCNCMSLVIFKM